ncbi:MAG TPA: hypothetical protein VGW77_17820 [Candidatus Binatia bacterium]|jgi:hypothetical protein|nr:hypothetical protein [Candidatus Binatia bacterium]
MKSRFKTLKEFYEVVDALTERLVAEHHDKEAGQLHTLMHEIAWTTGSELLGELTLALKNMNGKYSPELTGEIDECLEFAIHHRRILGLQ